MSLRKPVKPAPIKHASENRVIAVLRKHDGIITKTAGELGIARQSLYERIQRSKKIQAAVLQIEEEILDLGEGNVFKALRDGDGQMTRWAMERKGRKRGWGTRVENAVDDAQVEAFLAALGANPEAYRTALSRLGIDPSTI